MSTAITAVELVLGSDRCAVALPCPGAANDPGADAHPRWGQDLRQAGLSVLAEGRHASCVPLNAGVDGTTWGAAAAVLAGNKPKAWAGHLFACSPVRPRVRGSFGLVFAFDISMESACSPVRPAQSRGGRGHLVSALLERSRVRSPRRREDAHLRHSGFLYQANQVLFDEQTHSLWRPDPVLWSTCYESSGCFSVLQP